MPEMSFSRRDAIKLGLGAAGGVLLGCSFAPNLTPRGSPRLRARPHTPTGTVVPGQSVTFELESGQPMILYVPSGYQSSVPAPLVLMYDGAGGSAQGPINLFQPWADSAGIILVALNSYNSTWDGLIGGFGPDIRLSEAALAKAFDLCAVDASRVSVEGFSDGASYALAVGRANGDLFSRVAAFSPGVFLPVHATGTPKLYVSHASNDPVLPVENTRKMILVLRQSYDVTYREFSGGHFVPADIAEEGERWLAAPR